MVVAVIINRDFGSETEVPDEHIDEWRSIWREITKKLGERVRIDRQIASLRLKMAKLERVVKRPTEN